MRYLYAGPGACRFGATNVSFAYNLTGGPPTVCESQCTALGAACMGIMVPRHVGGAYVPRDPVCHVYAACAHGCAEGARDVADHHCYSVRTSAARSPAPPPAEPAADTSWQLYFGIVPVALVTSFAFVGVYVLWRMRRAVHPK